MFLKHNLLTTMDNQMVHILNYKIKKKKVTKKVVSNIRSNRIKTTFLVTFFEFEIFFIKRFSFF
jgi:hypothetical protein